MHRLLCKSSTVAYGVPPAVPSGSNIITYVRDMWRTREKLWHSLLSQASI
jgi:hypothetical protein